MEEDREGMALPSLHLHYWRDDDQSWRLWEPSESPSDDLEPPPYGLTISLGQSGRPPVIPFRMSDKEIDRLNLELLGILAQDRYKLDQDLSEGLSNEVALRSFEFLREALGEKGLEVLTQLLKDLEACTGDGATPLISVDDELGQSFRTFPWGLLHPTHPSPAASAHDGFLGYRFLLFKIQQSADGSAVHPHHEEDEAHLQALKLGVGLIDDRELLSVREFHERRSLDLLIAGRFDPFERVEIPEDSKEVEAEDTAPATHNPNLHRDAAVYLIQKDWAAMHFACHSELQKGRWWMQVRRKQALFAKKLRDELEREKKLKEHELHVPMKLLFLNFCHSTEFGFDRKQTKSTFYDLQPSVTISVINKICERIAAHLATAFYYELAQHNKVTFGDAFYAAVRQRLDATRNPAHLLFVYRGSPAMRF